MPKVSSTSTKDPEVHRKANQSGIVKSVKDSLVRLLWTKTMDEENNPQWKFSFQKYTEPYNPKIYKFIENTSKFIQPTETPKLHANCFEGTYTKK
jgi:hypothetical protein